ncbi:uncharacterized protein LOC143036866 [Oratosquilla oratoria]|uniref:uncharacterized protein LOC143036866 n=1 Tax=Oratosquilla oratoria TaxID=337810 RepID=UPI003F76241D
MKNDDERQYIPQTPEASRTQNPQEPQGIQPAGELSYQDDENIYMNVEPLPIPITHQPRPPIISESKRLLPVRDPIGLHQDHKISWEHVFAESSEPHSPQWCWDLKHNMFDFIYRWCYIVLAVICGPLAVCCFAISFACRLFMVVWCWTPVIKDLSLSCFYSRKLNNLILGGCVTPWCRAIFSGCSMFKVRYQKLPTPEKEFEEYRDIV